VNRTNQRRNKGAEDWRTHHQAYIALWDVRGSSQQHYLHGARHRSKPWVEYLRCLQHQSLHFLGPAYTQANIAELPDFDDDNEIVDAYDEMTCGDTVEPERGPFQNYVVSIFTLSFVIVTTVVQVTRLGWFTNEAADTLSHPPNTAASHNALRAFAKVSMVSISVLHRTISLNSLH
jgi:hypothetical protein